MNFFQQLINTYNKGLRYDSLSKDYMKVTVDLSNNKKLLLTERKQFTKAITDLEKENLLLYNDLDNAREDGLKPITSTFSLSNSLHALNKIIQPQAYKYHFKGDGRNYDIKYSLIVKDDSLVIKYADLINKKYQTNNPLDIVEAVIKYFAYIKKPVYITDDKQFNKRDYWAPIEDFLRSFKGDCDEIARAMHVIIKYLLDKKGFSEHYNRLYLCINDNYLGGHANNIWLHDDGYFYVIESSIDLKGSYKRKWLKVPLAFDSFYKSIRGIANLNGSHKGNNALLTGCFK